MAYRSSLSFLILTFALLFAVSPSLCLAQEDPDASPAVDGLRLTELTLARNIEAGRAIDPTNTFQVSDGRVWVLVRVENQSGAETEIRVSFERADRELGAREGAGVSLEIPNRRRYRTVARTGTRAPGRYRVVVRTASGSVLGSVEYDVRG